jgi:hypothetical protein
MKFMKSSAVGLTMAAIAALCIGASSGGEQRPSEVPAERWISIGDRAGFATRSVGGGAEQVVAHFYVKTARGWQQARIENPAHVTPLTR